MGNSDNGSREATGRRESDRRRDQRPYAGTERREGDRRSGRDRRTQPRI